jgi:hypothetical protein
MVPIFDESDALYYRVEVWDGDRVDLLLAKCARIGIVKAAPRGDKLTAFPLAQARSPVATSISDRGGW